MGAVEYKMWIDGESATTEQLDKIDEIVVDQAIDRAWEARVKIPVCVTTEGKWDGESDKVTTAFTRVRIEVNAGDGKFVPVIDGPVVSANSTRSAQPGKSVITIVVHDDSALLNREVKVDVQEGMNDSDLAETIFSDNLTGTPEIDDTGPQANQTTSAAVQNLTPMQYLRDLARRHPEWHAYVLPGTTPGKSIGCFKKFPTDTDGLPEMVLLGADRNINAFNVANKAQNPTSVKAATLPLDHSSPVTSNNSFRDGTLMGDPPATASGTPEAITQLPPGQSDRVDLDEATKGAAANSAFSLEATGGIVPFCYPAVLSPYRWVLVKISDSQFSTKYLITRVTHTLTRSMYTQSFSVKGNGVTVAAGGTPAGPQPSASLSVSFNLQLSIF
jgi:hypothetical protein